MGNKKLVQTLMPYLQKTNINEYVLSRVNNAVNMGKRNIDIVEVKCALQTTEMKDISRNFVVKHPKTSILYETPNGKVICIYGNQIFDATQNET